MGFVSTWRARGLAYSAGAGGSLIVAALCCLIFVGAMLAFRNWPEAGRARPDGSLSMRMPPAKAAGRAASGPVAAPSAAPSVRRSVASAPASRGRATAAPRRSGRLVAPAPGAPRTPAPSAPAAPATPAPSPRAPAATAPGASEPGAPAADAPAGPAETLVQNGRQVVENTVPPLPPAVEQPVNRVLETGRQVAGAVDGVTRPLLP